MTFNEYQDKAKTTAIFKEKDNEFIYAALGMMGEAGEVAEKIKKIWRDKGKIVSEKDREDIKLEIGDVLWYLSQLARTLNISLDSVAEANLDKLASRVKRNKLHGSGDNR